MTPGQFALRFFYTPVGRLKQCIREGGPWAQRKTERGRQEMEATGERFGALPTFDNAPVVTLHLMTGRRFWYQTVFCLHSFAEAARVNIAPEIYDDGSIDAGCRERLLRLGPRVKIHSASELRVRLDAHLPADRFPALRERWENYPNIRKLIDVHLASSGWKLVIDSDLLFFREPTVLVDWLLHPTQPLHAVDCTESYGYSRGLMQELAGAPIGPLINVGLCGLRSDELNWEKLEHWCAQLIGRERTNYYLEQALVAMLVSGRTCTIAPAKDYVTMPSRDEATRPTAVMHHYVDTSKRWYFQTAWRRVLPGS